MIWLTAQDFGAGIAWNFLPAWQQLRGRSGAGLARVMLPGAMTMALQRTLSQHPKKYF